MNVFQSLSRQVSVLSLIVFSAGLLVCNTALSEPQPERRINRLWSDRENCFEDGATMIAIETYKDTYKVAACAAYGCRISVPEFGKKTYQGNYKEDPRFTWISDKVFEAQVFGQTRRFYHCLTK